MRPRPLPDAFDARPFSRRAAVEAGVSDDRLARADLATPFRGVRLPGALVDDFAARVAALASRLPHGAAYTHSTAARLLGAPLPSRVVADTRLHVGRARPNRVTGEGIVAHRVDPDVWDWDLFPYFIAALPDLMPYVPVTSPALTWATCAESLSVDELVALGDAFVAKTRVRTTIASLEAIERVLRGGRGATNRAAAIQLIRPDSWSPMESYRRLCVVRAGLPQPMQNAPVCDTAGFEIGRPDEQWPEYRVLEEYEGERHADVRQFRRDLAKYACYRDAGWTVLQTTADDVHGDPMPSLFRLARALTAGGWRGSPGVPRRVAPIPR